MIAAFSFFFFHETFFSSIGPAPFCLFQPEGDDKGILPFLPRAFFLIARRATPASGLSEDYWFFS